MQSSLTSTLPFALPECMLSACAELGVFAMKGDLLAMDKYSQTAKRTEKMWSYNKTGGL